MRCVVRTTRFLSFLLACGTAACGGSLPHPRFMGQPTSALTIVPLPPPPARVEEVPPSPASGAVWVDGEWVYRNGRWSWSVGAWCAPPDGAFFSPWTMVRAKDGTLYHAPGVWRDAKGAPIPAPTPLAVATARSGPVVDAEGETETVGRNLKAGSASPAPPAVTPQPQPPALTPPP